MAPTHAAKTMPMGEFLKASSWALLFLYLRTGYIARTTPFGSGAGLTGSTRSSRKKDPHELKGRVGVIKESLGVA